MQELRLEYLFDCYVSEKCSVDEEKELMALLAESGNEHTVEKLLEKFIENTRSDIEMPKQVADSILQNILQNDKVKVIPFKNVKTNFKLWLSVAAAAVAILFISGTSYWMLKNEKKDKITASIIASEQTPAILPGGNHAILTMDNGRRIVLDSVQNGKIQNGNGTLNKQKGILVYARSSPSLSNMHVTYNTLTTPRGGQYQLVLPDGSKVWLNAASSLRFPTVFVGKQREVELTGEAYFEVAKNRSKPFNVKVNGMQVEVLGTHFNIDAYTDEDAIRTSLLEGSVKITKGNVSGLLKPGQQGVIKKNNEKIKIVDTDMNEVIAWKNGLFQFDGANIRTIMREIGRWYDVEIVYEGKVPSRTFEGKISRDVLLSDVLKILELNNVKFKLEGKKIIVL